MPPVEQIPTAQLKQDVDTAVSSHNFSHVFDELQQAEKGKTPQQQTKDLEQYRQIINEELQKKGFPEINLTMDDQGQMHVQDSKGKDIDPQHFAEQAAQPQTEKGSADKTPVPGQTKTDQVKDESKTQEKSSTDGQSQYWTDHERQDNEDGSSDVTVKKGDSLWKIAEHLCEQKLGHKMDPKNPKDMLAVMKMTKDLAKANKDHPIDPKTGRALIKEGDNIHVPKELKGKPAEAGQTPGDQDKKTGDPANPDKAETPHAGHHGKVETTGDTTKITQDNGGEITVKSDDKGNPTDVTMKGGDFDKAGNAGHWKKTGDHEWTEDGGSKWQGDITVGKDGTYTATDADGKSTEKDYPNGSRQVLDENGKPTKIESADGPHKRTYTKDADGTWTAQPGNEKFDDVTRGDDGTVTAKIGDGKKTMYPDGSQIDTDEKGNTTFVQSPDGKHQHSYTKGEDGKFTANPGGESFDDVKMGDDGTITAQQGNIQKKMYVDGRQVDTDEKGNATFVQSADGPHQHGYTKGDDGTWTAQPGGEQFSAVKMDDNGNVTATYDGGQKNMYADGRQVDTDSQGNDTFIQSPNGKNQDSYLKGADGTWHSQNGNEDLTDVKMDDKGNVVTSDAHGMTKNHYADGSQVDTDSHDRMTYMRTKDGVQYNLGYNTDESTVPQTINDGNGNNYNLESEGKYYNLNYMPERLKVQVTPGSISIEGAKGKSVVTAGNGSTAEVSDSD